MDWLSECGRFLSLFLQIVGGEFISAPPRHKHSQPREGTSSPDGSRALPPGGSAKSSGPPSPILGSPIASTPFADKVASFKDNLRERFHSHRKNSEEDRERLFTPTTEVCPPGGALASSATTTITQSPGLIGKIVKKVLCNFFSNLSSDDFTDLIMLSSVDGLID